MEDELDVLEKPQSQTERARVWQSFSAPLAAHSLSAKAEPELVCISLPAVLLNTILHANVPVELKLMLSRSCTLPCLLQASLWLILQLIPKQERGEKQWWKFKERRKPGKL